MIRVQDIEMYAPRMNEERLVGGRYRLEEVIGRGAMKDVYRGRDLQTDERVAIARMVGCDGEVLSGEVELARKVQSPHVAQIRDAFIEEDVAYIVSELCTGPTLARRVEERPFTLEEGLPIFLAMAAGLEAIHEARILHRDLKLNNVVLRERSDEVSIAILDFGISAPASSAKTAVGVLAPAGTLGYMPLESVLGEACDARSDVYALGVCFFEMLTGRPPLPQGDSVFAFLDAFRHLEAHDLSPLPAMPEDLRALIERMLSMQKEDRPYAPEVRGVLEHLVREERTTVARPSRSAQGPRGRRLLLSQVASIPHAGARHPETVVVSGWTWAPLVTLTPGASTTKVQAFTSEGLCRWSTEVPGDYRRGITVDLDADGVRELYVYGPSGIACLDARGRLAHASPGEARGESADPTAFVVEDPLAPCLVVDGRRYLRGGRFLGAAPRTYEGDGKALVDARDGRGLAYNGYAGQAFRGAFRTPAAILHKREANGFWVAHLEVSARRAATQVQLRVYGPGGARVQEHEVAVSSFPTGDARAVKRFVSSEEQLFDDRQAPIALERDGDFVVVVPFLGAVEPFSPVLVAFSAPRGGELWRLPLPGARSHGALFADVDGDGAPELVVGAQGEEALRVLEPGTGRVIDEPEVSGAPIAYGDPFGTGFGHLVTLSEDEIGIWRGPPTLPGRMEWSGPRADRWRSGTLSKNGAPLGPA